MFIVFFFSSRRRHTRCLSDWSSDVCSSDLVAAVCEQSPERLKEVARRFPNVYLTTQIDDVLSQPDVHAVRSEERRVGKECRYRVRPEYHKDNDEHLKYMPIDDRIY